MGIEFEITANSRGILSSFQDIQSGVHQLVQNVENSGVKFDQFIERFERLKNATPAQGKAELQLPEKELQNFDAEVKRFCDGLSGYFSTTQAHINGLKDSLDLAEKKLLSLKETPENADTISKTKEDITALRSELETLTSSINSQQLQVESLRSSLGTTAVDMNKGVVESSKEATAALDEEKTKIEEVANAGNNASSNTPPTPPNKPITPDITEGFVVDVDGAKVFGQTLEDAKHVADRILATFEALPGILERGEGVLSSLTSNEIDVIGEKSIQRLDDYLLKLKEIKSPSELVSQGMYGGVNAGMLDEVDRIIEKIMNMRHAAQSVASESDTSNYVAEAANRAQEATEAEAEARRALIAAKQAADNANQIAQRAAAQPSGDEARAQADIARQNAERAAAEYETARQNAASARQAADEAQKASTEKRADDVAALNQQAADYAASAQQAADAGKQAAAGAQEARQMAQVAVGTVTRMRTEIMNAREQLMQMIAQGKVGTPEFQELAMKAGEMRRQMTLANKTMQYFAEPNRHLSALKTGLQGVAGAVGLVNGVMGLFNTNSERMAAIQTRIQSVLGIVVGLETTYNLVKKTSFVRLALLEAKTWLLSAARGASAAATAAETAEELSNTVASASNTVSKEGNVSATAEATTARGASAIATAAETSALNENTTATIANSAAKGDIGDVAEGASESIGGLVDKVGEVEGAVGAAEGAVASSKGIFDKFIQSIKNLGSALTASYSVLLLIPAAMIGIAVAINKYARRSRELTEEEKERAEIQRMINTSMHEGAVAAIEEKTKLDYLYKTATNVNVSLEQRKWAVDQLQKQYPNYFGNLSQEAILAGEASKAYQQLTGDIVKAAQARAMEAKLTEVATKYYEEERGYNADTNWLNRNADQAYVLQNNSPYTGATTSWGITAGLAYTNQSYGPTNEYSGRQQRQQQHSSEMARLKKQMEAMAAQIQNLWVNEPSAPPKNGSSGNSGSRVGNRGGWNSGSTWNAQDAQKERERMRTEYANELAELVADWKLEASRMAEDVDDLFDVTHNVIEQARREYDNAQKEAEREATDALSQIEDDIEEQAQKLWELQRDTWVNSGPNRQAKDYSEDWNTEAVRNKYIDALMYKVDEGGDRSLTDFGQAIQARQKAVEARMKGTLARAQHTLKETLRSSLSEDLNAMTTYLKEYGNVYQKKLAIALEYEDKIRKVREDKTLTDEQRNWQVKQLQSERDRNVTSADNEELLKSIDWNGIFGGFTEMAEVAIRDQISKLTTVINRPEFKDISLEEQEKFITELRRLEDMLPGGKGIANFTKLNEMVTSVTANFLKLKLAQEAEQQASVIYNTSAKALAKANEELTAALASGDQTRINAAKSAYETANSILDADEEELKKARQAREQAQIEYTTMAQNARDAIQGFIDGLNGIKAGLDKLRNSDSFQGLGEGFESLMNGLMSFDASEKGITGFLGKAGEALSKGLGNLAQKLLGGKAATEAVETITQTTEGLKEAQELTNMMTSGALSNVSDIVGATADVASGAADAIASAEDAATDLGGATVTASKSLQNITGKLPDQAAFAAFNAMLSLLDLFKDGIGKVVSEIVANIVSMIGSLIANTISDAINPKNIIANVGNVFSAVTKSVEGVFDAITFGGFSKLFGGNAADVRKSIDNLEARNERLGQSIDNLTEEMQTARGATAILISKQAAEAQKERDANLKRIAQEQASYHNTHHSFNYYWEGFNREQIKRLSGQIGREWNGDLWGLDAKEMKVLLGNIDMLEAIKNTGEGGYGGRVLERLQAWANEAGKVDDILAQLYQTLTTTTADDVFDDFLNSLYSLADGSEDVMDDIADNWQKMVNRMVVNNLVGAKFQKKLEEWYERLAKLNQLRTEGKIDDVTYRRRLAELEKQYQGYVSEAQSEIEAFRSMGIIQTTDEYDKFSQEGTKQEYSGSFTQDSMDEFNGRMTTNNTLLTQILAQTVTLAAGNAQVQSVSVEQNRTLQEMRGLQITANSYLEDIARYSRLSYDDFSVKLDTIANNLA